MSRILPLLDLDETRDELAAVQRDLDQMDTTRIVDPERRAELKATRIHWRDRLADQIAQIEHDERTTPDGRNRNA